LVYFEWPWGDFGTALVVILVVQPRGLLADASRLAFRRPVHTGRHICRPPW
jgi:hypothetical protein